jgi:hypothetical protein
MRLLARRSRIPALNQLLFLFAPCLALVHAAPCTKEKSPVSRAFGDRLARSDV